MKYKVGDEVLVKVRIHHIVNQETDMPYEVKAINNGKIEPRTIWIREEDIQSDSPMTAEEAWELARRIVGCSEHGLEETKRREIFSRDDAFDVFNLFSAKEAKAKIEAWEAEKEIKVGDVVDICGDKGIVTSFGTDGDMIHVLYLDGIVNSYRKGKDIKKTGRHIDIEGILKQIGGTDA